MVSRKDIICSLFSCFLVASIRMTLFPVFYMSLLARELFSDSPVSFHGLCPSRNLFISSKLSNFHSKFVIRNPYYSINLQNQQYCHLCHSWYWKFLSCFFCIPCQSGYKFMNIVDSLKNPLLITSNFYIALCFLCH